MALVKHKTSKNARYGDALDYFSFKHEEDMTTGHYEPILDEYGLMQERENYAIAYINAKGEEDIPEKWSANCVKTNMQFKKNLHAGDRKNHEYIISHPSEDREKMTTKDLLDEGKAFAKKYFPGYDCLIAVHRDTDNDHIHIVINSVRALHREEQEWMMKKNGEILPCEMEAGGKHQDSPQLRRHMNDWLLDYTRQHGYIEKDNNAIADVHRAQRHGSKNEQMKAALLESVGRSKDVKELQRIMKDDYNMELKIRGNTFSVLYPGNKKAVRLRTLGLEPAELTRRMSGEQYRFTKEAEEQLIQKEIESKEKQKYAEWLKSVRDRNNEKAERTIEEAEDMLVMRIRGKGEKYSKEEFQDLRYLIRQTSYVAGNLQIELEKVDRLLDRWEQYRNTDLTEQERRQHGGYVKWCGCDPDNDLEFADLEAEREVIVAQQEHAAAMHEGLMAEAEEWRDRNNLTYAENNLAWQKQREHQLKRQLKSIKASQKKLWEIAYNCERSARKYGKTQNYAKAKHFREKWEEKVWQEVAVKQKLKETKQKKREAKKKLKEVRKETEHLFE